MKINNFVVFILTHGRPNNVYTYNSLKKCGYTGKIVFILDNEDKTIEQYKKRYKDVYVFDKAAAAKKFDCGDNSGDKRSIVFARNACFDIAEELGYKYFIELDDDYTSFDFSTNAQGEYINHKKVLDLDRVFTSLLSFYKKTNILSISLAQGGDFIGGASCGVFKKKLARKCMNSFVCSTDRRFTFLGRINEDVNTYTCVAKTGGLLFTLAAVRLEQQPTQKTKGGMTDIYLDGGTYIKSFFSVMYSPSCVKVCLMGHVDQRLHHRVSWNKAVPKIIREKYKKKIPKN